MTRVRGSRWSRGFRWTWLLAAMLALPAASGSDLVPGGAGEPGGMGAPGGLGESGRMGEPGKNLELLGRLHTRFGYTNIWGYSAPDGTELALVGTQAGTQIVDVTDPRQPEEVAFLEGTLSNWRELRTHGHHLYIVNDTLSDHALQIVDLADPRAPQLVYSGSDFFRRAHTVFIDSETGVLYAAGAQRTARGYVALDLADPAAPQLLGTFDAQYLHDLYVRDGILYGAAIEDGQLLVLEVQDPAAPAVLARVPYLGAATHNTWLTDDGRHCLTTDEVAGGHIRVFDVLDPRNPVPVAEWLHPEEPGSSVHNVHVRGSVACVAWYTAGVVLLDVSDPTFPQRIAYYDTYPGSEQVLFDGVWGVYPYLASGNILANDMSTGLYILRYVPNHAQVPITVRDAASGDPLPGVALGFPDEAVDPGRTAYTDEFGSRVRLLSPGSQRIAASLFGFHDETVTLDAEANQTQPVEIEMTRLPAGTIAGEIHSASGPVEHASVRVVGTPLETFTDAAGRFLLPAVPAGTWAVEVERFGFRGERFDSLAVAAGMETPLDLVLAAALFQDDFETDRGWSPEDPGDTATRGRWERADPLGTGFGRIQPEDDGSEIGTSCFVTENGAPGDGVAVHDVDEGETTLQSPPLDLTGIAAPVLEYARWYYSSDSGHPARDELRVEVSGDGGATWGVLERVIDSTEGWERVRFRLDCVVTLGPDVRVRFVARDGELASLVEAGIDDVQIYPAAIGDDPEGCLLEDGLVRLDPAIPNPFQLSTELTFRLGAAGPVRLRLYDAAGRRIRTVFSGDLGIGERRIVWDGTDDHGERVPSGVYWLRLDANGREVVQRIVRSR